MAQTLPIKRKKLHDQLLEDARDSSIPFFHRLNEAMEWEQDWFDDPKDRRSCYIQLHNTNNTNDVKYILWFSCGF